MAMLDSAIVDRLTYRIAAVIICITCIFYSTMMRKRNRIRNRLFSMLVYIVLIDSLTEPISFLAINSPIPQVLKWVISYGSQVVYYFTHFGMMPVFVFYIIVICGVDYKVSKLQKILLKVPIYLLEIMLLTNPFTELTFVITGELQYGRGVGIYIAYAMSAIYLAATIYVLIRYWYCLNSMKRIAMLYFISLVIIGTVVQMLLPNIKCELLCDSIGLAGLMLMIEKEDDRIDTACGTYNRNAFVQDVGTYFNVKREFTVFCLRISNLVNFRKVSAYEKMDELVVQISNFLMDNINDNNVYHTSVDVFYILCTDMDKKTIREYAEKIMSRFDYNWGSDEDNIKLDALLLVADCPQQFGSLNDIFLLSSTNISDNDRNILMGNDLDFLLRKIAIEKAIGRGIGEKKFRLVYRPIYKTEGLHIKLAQAALSLDDEELGDVRYREFMDVAEGSGFIEEMQKKTIEDVCRFLATGVDISDMQMDYVLIPIMSASMLKKEFIDYLKGEISHFGIDPSLIALEIKESYVFLAKEALSETLKILSDYGIRLFISDYEAGFLGLNALTSYEFVGAIINIKSIFGSDNIGNAKIVLNNRMNLLKQLGKMVIISGIDSLQTYEKIQSVPVDYVEGDLLSAFVSKNELQNKFWHGEHLMITKEGVDRYEEDEF